MRVCPTRYGKQVGPNASKGDALKKNLFDALRTREAKSYVREDDDGKFLYFCSVMSSFYVGSMVSIWAI